MSIRILAVNVATPTVLLKWPGGDVISSIDKKPVSAPSLRLSELNLEGDEQADQRPTPSGEPVHGGVHQAVYAYPSEHYPRLTELMGRPLPWGFMGENLTLDGAIEDDVCIGDTWRWGSALLQVSAPRGPCYKAGIRMGKQALRTAIRAEALVGWYLRVLEQGVVPTTGEITMEARHQAGATVGRVHRALQDRANVYPELADLDVLSPKLRLALRVRDRDLSGGVPEKD